MLSPTQDLGDLNKDNLVQLQVKQIEKEKKDQSERLRILAKRLDHTERAYRKEERPLLALDYQQQQAEDKAAHALAQKARLEAARLQHKEDLETKKRLGRMLSVVRERRREMEEHASYLNEGTRRVRMVGNTL